MKDIALAFAPLIALFGLVVACFVRNRWKSLAVFLVFLGVAATCVWLRFKP